MDELESKDQWMQRYEDLQMESPGSMDPEIWRSENGDSSICGSTNVEILGSKDL